VAAAADDYIEKNTGNDDVLSPIEQFQTIEWEQNNEKNIFAGCRNRWIASRQSVSWRGGGNQYS